MSAQKDRGREPQGPWRIRTDAGLPSLADVRRFVEAVTTSVDLDGKRAFDVKVAVSEACANAMEHAHGRSATVEVRADIRNSRLLFEIIDSGCFAAPGAVAQSDGGLRGLGLPLMITLMDEVGVRRVPEQGTVVTLAVYLDRSPLQARS
jgi:anti-sigma regulatory factor (Ser/Thr protein kinase)